MQKNGKLTRWMVIGGSFFQLGLRGQRGSGRWICGGEPLRVLASAAHVLKSEQYREDQRGPCAGMTRKFVKRSIFLGLRVGGGGGKMEKTVFKHQLKHMK